jgi:hypothetical protein
MEFQVAGDLHVQPGSSIKDFSTILSPNKPFLLTTGDIVQPYSQTCYTFYTYCATNWDKTYIIMGNQEYECTSRVFHQTMQKQFELMLQLIAHINSEVGSERLVCIHDTFIDLPEHSLRIAGLTLWADKTRTSQLKKDVLKEGETYTDVRVMNGSFTVKHKKGEYGGGASVDSWSPFKYATLPALYSSIEDEDLIELQKKDIEFIDRMIHETTEKGYRLLICSHYVPTTLIKKESPIISSENEFPIDFFCRDVIEKIKSPIVAWVCGHVHLEQTVIVNSIPIYVNVPSIVV